MEHLPKATRPVGQILSPAQGPLTLCLSPQRLLLKLALGRGLRGWSCVYSREAEGLGPKPSGPAPARKPAAASVSLSTGAGPSPRGDTLHTVGCSPASLGSTH